MTIRAVGLALAVGLATVGVGLGQASAQTTTTITYSYDVLGRVTTVANTAAPSLQTSYAYDPAGNRLQHFVGAAGGGTASTATAAAPSTAATDTPPTQPANGVSCNTTSQHLGSGTPTPITVTFNPLSQCSDSTTGATMALSSWNVTGAGTGTLTSSSPPTVKITLTGSPTTISFTAADNDGGSASGAFTFYIP